MDATVRCGDLSSGLFLFESNHWGPSCRKFSLAEVVEALLIKCIEAPDVIGREISGVPGPLACAGKLTGSIGAQYFLVQGSKPLKGGASRITRTPRKDKYSRRASFVFE